jgi:hypothetical protein
LAVGDLGEDSLVPAVGPLTDEKGAVADEHDLSAAHRRLHTEELLEGVGVGAPGDGCVQVGDDFDRRAAGEVDPLEEVGAAPGEGHPAGVLGDRPEALERVARVAGHRRRVVDDGRERPAAVRVDAPVRRRLPDEGDAAVLVVDGHLVGAQEVEVEGEVAPARAREGRVLVHHRDELVPDERIDALLSRVAVGAESDDASADGGDAELGELARAAGNRRLHVRHLDDDVAREHRGKDALRILVTGHDVPPLRAAARVTRSECGARAHDQVGKDNQQDRGTGPWLVTHDTSGR